MTYEGLQQECLNNGIYVIDKIFISNVKGLIKGNRIGISKKIPTIKEKKCILLEEIGHYKLTVGNIIDQSIVENRKQERKARIYAYNKLIGLSGLIDAFEAHCTSKYEVADYLDVTEAFLNDALQYYEEKYAPYIKKDNYIISFENGINILKLFENF
ncbi:phage protein [Lachnospiraceae bacterium KM106-2]|nr:phage protein [Lachnospiraceae bacterium KM106-2]